MLKIISGSSNKKLAEKLAKKLDTRLTKTEIFIFPDKERRIRILEDVLDKYCVILQSANTPADQNYMELFFLADGLKRSGAKKVTAVIPYLGYQRQDHIFRSGEAVSLQVIVETLEAVGIDDIIALDLHSVKIPSFFKIPIKHLSALGIFAEEIKTILKDLKNIVLVSPDMGGIGRIKKLSKMLGDVPFVAIEKDRNLATGKVVAKKIKGDVSGKTAVIVDDMISTGKTIVEAARLLKEKGALDIFVFVTHGVFSENAKEILGKSLVEKVFVTDSVYVPEEKKFKKLEILTIANLLAKTLEK